MKATKITNVNHVANPFLGQSQHLKRHIHIVHEEHKDYKCEYCSKAFALEQNLKKHIQAVHEGYTYNKPVKPQTDLDDYWDTKHWSVQILSLMLSFDFRQKGHFSAQVTPTHLKITLLVLLVLPSRALYR